MAIMNGKPILQIADLTKEYQTLRAVDHVSFAVNAGEIAGLLGPNGAGKTTIISMILGVLEPTSGTIVISGKDIAHNRAAVMSETNFAAVYAQAPGNLTVWQNLYIFGLLYGVADLKNKIRTLLEEFSLIPFSDARAGLLSSGEQTRLQLAKALLNTPRLLLLDEPTASLDPSTARNIREKIQNYGRSASAAILWTSHNMYEVESVCDRVLFLSRGKILLEGDPRRLPAEHGKRNLEELFIAIAREPLSLELDRN
jgi:ABC-2 type transport system ATP-binding protein